MEIDWQAETLDSMWGIKKKKRSDAIIQMITIEYSTLTSMFSISFFFEVGVVVLMSPGVTVCLASVSGATEPL